MLRVERLFPRCFGALDVLQARLAEDVPDEHRLAVVGFDVRVVDVVKGRGVEADAWQRRLDKAHRHTAVQVEVERDEAGHQREVERRPVQRAVNPVEMKAAPDR